MDILILLVWHMHICDASAALYSDISLIFFNHRLSRFNSPQFGTIGSQAPRSSSLTG